MKNHKDLASGHRVMFNRSLKSDEATYAELLTAEAEVLHSHPWVKSPSQKLVDATRVLWSRLAPGWVRDDSDKSIRAHLEHSAISHHLAMIGGTLLSPDAAHAARLLEKSPTLAARMVYGYMGFDGTLGRYTVAELLAAEGSALAVTKQELDLDAYDGDIERFRRVTRRGESVVDYVLRIKKVKS